MGKFYQQMQDSNAKHVIIVFGGIYLLGALTNPHN